MDFETITSGADEYLPGHTSALTGPIMATRIRSPRRQHQPISPFRDLARTLEQLLAWSDSAECRGANPDTFFPARGMSTEAAKRVCRGCVVQDKCLEWALTTNERFGVWGGMSEKERRRERRRRGLATPQPPGLVHSRGAGTAATPSASTPASQTA